MTFKIGQVLTIPHTVILKDTHGNRHVENRDDDDPFIIVIEWFVVAGDRIQRNTNAPIDTIGWTDPLGREREMPVRYVQNPPTEDEVIWATRF